MLSYVEGEVGSPNRKLKPSSELFALDSPNMTAAVTLDLGTSASKNWLKVELNATKKIILFIDNDLEGVS